MKRFGNFLGNIDFSDVENSTLNFFFSLSLSSALPVKKRRVKKTQKEERKKERRREREKTREEENETEKSGGR